MQYCSFQVHQRPDYLQGNFENEWWSRPVWARCRRMETYGVCLFRRIQSPMCCIGRCGQVYLASLPSDAMMAFTASRLIPLNKSPGVRPIAIGKIFPCIIGHAVMEVVERDVMLAVAPNQLCVGIPSACEAAVHAMSKLYSHEETEGILLVDGKNALSSLNR